MKCNHHAFERDCSHDLNVSYHIPVDIGDVRLSIYGDGFSLNNSSSAASGLSIPPEKSSYFSRGAFPCIAPLACGRMTQT